MNGSDLTEEQREKAMRESLRILSKMDFNLPPVGVSLILHDALRNAGISRDPYLDLKRSSTANAKEILPDMRKMLDDTGDRLHLSALMSIAGNVIDYGAANQLDLEKTLLNAVEKGLGIDDVDLFRIRLKDATSIAFFLDNSGEVVLDGLFIREIVRINPKIKVHVYAKKVPLLNDVTVEDAKEGGIDSIDNVILKELPHDGWVLPEDLGPLREDIVIAKGQGNYESLSWVGDIFFLLVVKCNVVSRELGADIGQMVFKFHNNLLLK